MPLGPVRPEPARRVTGSRQMPCPPAQVLRSFSDVERNLKGIMRYLRLGQGLLKSLIMGSAGHGRRLVVQLLPLAGIVQVALEP